jgi:hypothetical protein
MKKQRSNNKFLKIAAVSLALLALPPLAVYGQTVRCRAAQPRPALPGVMSDEIRLDPVAGALYRYGVQGGINRADSYWSDNVFTVLRGKLKQAAARGLLSREQLDCLLDRVAEGEAHAGPVQPPRWAPPAAFPRRPAVRSSPTSCGPSFCRTARPQRRSLPTTRIF